LRRLRGFGQDPVVRAASGARKAFEITSDLRGVDQGIRVRHDPPGEVVLLASGAVREMVSVATNSSHTIPQIVPKNTGEYGVRSIPTSEFEGCRLAWSSIPTLPATGSTNARSDAESSRERGVCDAKHTVPYGVPSTVIVAPK